MIKGVIFDIGGVLAYDIQEYLFSDTKDGIPAKYNLDERHSLEIMGSLWEKYAFTKKDQEDSWKDLEVEYWIEFNQKANLSIPVQELIELSKKFVKPVEGMVELLKWLQENHYDLLICSNNIEFWFQRQGKIAQFRKYFQKQKIILSNHYGRDKSDNDFTLFKALERQLDYKKEEYLFIDDRKTNIDISLQFGITPILFPTTASYGANYIKEILLKINS